MNAVVEVATAGASCMTGTFISLASRANSSCPVIPVVVASLPRVISQGSHSISAVAPDTNFMDRRLALGFAA